MKRYCIYCNELMDFEGSDNFKLVWRCPDCPHEQYTHIDFGFVPLPYQRFYIDDLCRAITNLVQYDLNIDYRVDVQFKHDPIELTVEYDNLDSLFDAVISALGCDITIDHRQRILTFHGR